MLHSGHLRVNIALGQEGLHGTNTLAYLTPSQVLKRKKVLLNLPQEEKSYFVVSTVKRFYSRNSGHKAVS